MDRSRRIGSPTAVVALLMALPVVAEAKSSPRDVGFVLEISGEWFVPETRTRLLVGHALREGAVIQARPPASPDAGKVALTILRWDGVADRFECVAGSECRFPAPVIMRSQFRDRLSRAAKALVQPAPRRYVVVATRAPGGLREAVLELDEGELDIAPLLPLEGGPAVLELLEVDADGSSLHARGILEIDETAERPLRVSVEGVSPGLHVVRVLTRTEVGLEPSGDDALVLVLGPGRHARAAEAFDDVASRSSAWNVAETTRRDLLRAVLEDCWRRGGRP